jgi:hypothetical protein
MVGWEWSGGVLLVTHGNGPGSWNVFHISSYKVTFETVKIDEKGAQVEWGFFGTVWGRVS